MRRDCGHGELIPVRFEVVYTIGRSDDENESSYSTLAEALAAFDLALEQVKQTACSDVRLYAVDKQKYANCIKGVIHQADGNLAEMKNRISEL